MNIPLTAYWYLLAQYLRPQRWRVAALAIFLFSNIALQLLNPQIMGRFLDGALTGRDIQALSQLALWFIAIAITQQIASVATTYVGENVSWTATNWLRNDLVGHCLHLDLTFHNSHTPGEMIERIDGDVNTLSTFFSQFVLQIVGNGVLLLGILLLLYAENISIGLAMTLFVGLTLLVVARMRNIGVPYFTAGRVASADFFSFLEERLAGTEEIRASGAKSYVIRRFFELLRRYWLASLKARVASASMINVAWTLFSIGNALAFVLGASLYQHGKITLGGVYILFHYTNMLGRPIEAIFREFDTFQQAGAGITRIQELFQASTTLTVGGNGQIGQDGAALAVVFEDISFGYPDDDPQELILRGVTFELPPGRVLGLLGRTGSGKTTLIRLLFRLYDVNKGAVRLAGHDVRHLSLAGLRRQIGMVTQNVQLFNASIRDNLTFFDCSFSDEQILTILHDLGLGQWLATQEQGLDSVLPAGGGGLSAGEAQLLAFARVFLKNPGLVVLDEASSRLDPVTEQLIERAIDRLLQNRTAIIIAHRLATVERADEILILENGAIVEHAARQQLVADPTSRFYQLLQTGLEEVLV